MSHAPEPSGSRRRAEFAVLLATCAVVTAGAAIEFAGGHPADGALALSAAFFGVVAAGLSRLNWRLIEVNRALIAANAELLYEVAARESSLPPRWRGDLARKYIEGLN